MFARRAIKLMVKAYKFWQVATKLFVYSYSIFIITYLLLNLLFGDRFWFVALIGIFIPLILLPILLLPIFALKIIEKRWFFIISSIACLILLGWLHLKYFSPNSSAISSNAIAVLSLNKSWYKTSSPTLIKLLEKEKPDLVFLQEVVKKHTINAFPKLRSSYPYQVGKPPVAILSKYPIRSPEIIHLAGHRESQQRAIMELEGTDIVLYNIQTMSPWIRPQKILPFLTIPVYDFERRSAEIEDLVKRLQKETAPVIVAGDFNLTEQSEDYKKLTTILKDTYAESGFGFGFTWPQGWKLSFLIPNSTWKLNYPLFRIDYIWCSKDFQSRSTEILPTTGSDHLPIKTKLNLS